MSNVKYRVQLTDQAEADVDSVLRWFRDQRATGAGGRWYATFIDKLSALEVDPERCPVAPESDVLGDTIHEVLIGKRFKHRILYRIRGKVVVILRVWHSSRDTPKSGDLI